MKKFVIGLLRFLPVPILILAVNYFEDPANIFRKGEYEAGIVDNLIKGNHVSNISNYDERLLQKYFIEKLQYCPETIILGSSRVMQLGKGFFNGEKLINNGVSGASIEDFLAIYELYEKKGCRPKKVLIGLEPYYLNENNDQTRWKVLSEEYMNSMKKLAPETEIENVKLIDSKYTKYKELWSLTYFKNSLNYIFRGIDLEYKPVKTEINKDLTKLTDGSITYSEESRNSPMSVINGYANASINEIPMYSMRDFRRLSEKNKDVLVKFFTHLLQQGTEIEIFILPYHPTVYDYCKRNSYYNTVFQAEKYYYRMADSLHLKIRGSYDPVVNHFTDSSFYDGFHCKEKTLSEIIK
jgi:hypothetical protein